jgi:hypothetical protein
MPSLQTLPLELRQKIYTLAFNSFDATKIGTHSRQRDKYSRPEEVALPVLRDGQVERTPNNDTALIRVSKEVSADARPILYGYHKFSFEDTRALELFLEQIGDMKQHLRYVALDPSGYEQNLGTQSPLYSATKRSFAMLAAATQLQTLSVAHYDFCRSLYLKGPSNDFRNLVTDSAQLLQAIVNARRSKGLKVNASLLDIVKIELPDCSGCFTCNKSAGKQYTTIKRGVRFKQGCLTRSLRCCCKCLDAEGHNKALMAGFKLSVADTLRLG